MKIVQETTLWTGAAKNTPNHIYLLNDDMTKAMGYIRAGTDVVKKFTKPQTFHKRDRTFQFVK